MAKLVKLTSNIELPCLTSDPQKCEGEPTFIFYPKLFGVLNIKSVRNGQVV